jgi:hypothetical protein
MFVYGVAAGPSDKFETVCRPSLDRYANGPVLVRRGQVSIFPAYNSLLQDAAGRDDLEGVVLLHDDVELRADLEPELRDCFADPTVGLVGVVGARTDGFVWSDGERKGKTSDSAYSYDYGTERAEVDAVDGLLLALSPWAVRTLRFDETSFRGFHGYDRDICSQVKAAGRRVLVADLPVHHHSKPPEVFSAGYLRAQATWEAKWLTGRSRLAARARLGKLAIKDSRVGPSVSRVRRKLIRP